MGQEAFGECELVLVHYEGRPGGDGRYNGSVHCTEGKQAQRRAEGSRVGLDGAVRRPDLDPHSPWGHPVSWAEQGPTPFQCPPQNAPQQPPHSPSCAEQASSGAFLLPPLTARAWGAGRQRPPCCEACGWHCTYPAPWTAPHAGPRDGGLRPPFGFSGVASALTSFPPLSPHPLMAAPHPVPSIQHRVTLV